MMLNQRQFRRIVVIVSIGVAMTLAGGAIVGIWLIYELSGGPERRGLAIAAVAPYSSAKNLQRVNQAPANQPTDGRDPWLSQAFYNEGVQAGNQYIAQFRTPQNTQVLTDMTTAEIWSFMQQQVAGALGVGCQYCHNVKPDANGNYQFNSEEFPQKIAARNMLKLVNDLNGKFIVNLPYWRLNYITCATCHSGIGNGRGSPQLLEAVSDQFLKSTPPIKVIYNPLDVNGQPVVDDAKKPEELRDPIPLKQATLWNVYNYKVWKPYNPADAVSGRGSLALSYDGGRTQEQANITQGTMNLLAWSLGVGCTYCHNARNFYSYEITNESPTFVGDIPTYQGKHIAPRLKAQRMLLMTTYIAENWDKYGAIPKVVPPESSLVGRVHYREINGQYYNVPGCYTCHGRNSIPMAVINQATLDQAKQPLTILPGTLQGQNVLSN